jgi:type I restriction enzyme S subunit
LALILHKEYEEKRFFNLCHKWIGQAGINISTLSELQIPVPPLSVQEQIVAKYTEIEQIKKGNMRLVEILEGEIKGVINELFN